MRRLLILLLLASCCLPPAKAQVYTMEVGGGLGVTSYEGDYNGSILKDGGVAAAALWRYLFNPRMGVKLDLGYTKLKHASAFSTPAIDLNAMYEYNFWPYGTGMDYRGAKRLTPFLTLGLGATYANSKDKGVIAANLPIGLGLKYKIGNRTNLNLSWVMHFSSSDRLDNAVDPLLVNSSGWFKNKDCYSGLMLHLTYSFREKCKTCHNDDE